MRKLLQEHNEALRKALEVKKAELSQAVAAARHASPQPEASPAEDLLAEKVSVMEQKAEALAAQLHGKVSNRACPNGNMSGTFVMYLAYL